MEEKIKTTDIQFTNYAHNHGVKAARKFFGAKIEGYEAPKTKAKTKSKAKAEDGEDLL
jgi:hypothetical protein